MTGFFRRLGFVPAPELRMSEQRIHRTVLDERAREYAGDVEYRDRVKRRMLLGYACPEPPLIDAVRWRRARMLRVVREP